MNIQKANLLRPAQLQIPALHRPYLKSLKYGVWLYFYLLIFEGALRKWVLPGLSGPLLVIRDPIAIWLLLIGWNKGLIGRNPYVIIVVLIGFTGFFTAIFFGHGNVWVAIYGLRILVIHFPLIFLIGSVFSREDVLQLGKAALLLSLPMIILTGLQFYSPQSALVNRGVGGDMAGGGFVGAMGYYRPPGTFSFTNGLSSFFSFVAFYVFYFWIDSKNINRFLLVCATFALLASIPLSISRSLFFSVIVAALFALIGVFKKPKYFGRVAGALVGVVVLLIILSQLSFFQTASAAFTDRFTSANEAEGGLQGVVGDRYFGGMISAITNSYQLPFFGLGLGLGTNAGAQLLTGRTDFLISEGEWGRLIGELGLLLGILVILSRVVLSVELTVASFGRLSRSGDILPWMMLGFALLFIPQSQWAQPTVLGFSTMSGGLLLASLNNK